MAGHSKWANIQHRKKAQDQKRGKIFTRINRELTVAARQGGGDIDTNPALRLAVDKANAANMPKDNIDRAIKKATGDLEGVTYEQTRYEGYGPGGVAVMVDCLTDNKNRTVAEVRHAFSKHNGNLGTDGSVAYLFNKIGVLNFAPGQDEDVLMEAAIEAGADDIVFADDNSAEVLASAENFIPVRDRLQALGLQPENAELTMRASTEVELDEDTSRKVLKLLDALEDLDDTQDVFSNADITDAAYD
ncbi:MAG: YebC/PmpR family DNA-binding transcriptional regulator [Gammaproteobacteria bacterium]|nr:YebC/PmpR family DNA-binding transcriptional regulator [Gammaproteobacteria bacterium]